MPRKLPQVLGVDLNRSVSGQSFSGLDFQDFSGLFGKPSGGFASRCSGFGHGCFGQPPLVGGLGVADKFREASVAGDCPDLVRGAASLGQASGCGLSQSVRRAMRKPRLVTFAPEPMGEGRSGERAADRRRQERQMTAQGCGNSAARSGCIGIASSALVFSCLTYRVPPRTCCAPMRITSPRRCPV